MYLRTIFNIHPSPSTHILWKASDLVHVVFFPGHQKIHQGYCIFSYYFHPQEKNLQYGTDALYVIYILVYYTFIIWYSLLKDSS